MPQQQVLEQMGHAGLAIALVPRADAEGEVHRGGRPGVVRHQQQLQAIGQPVLGDAFNLGDAIDAGRKRRRAGLGTGAGDAACRVTHKQDEQDANHRHDLADRNGDRGV